MAHLNLFKKIFQCVWIAQGCGLCWPLEAYLCYIREQIWSDRGASSDQLFGLILAVKMASTEVEYQPAQEKKTGIAASIQGFRKYMWNSETGEFMGRTGNSWGEYALRTFHAINAGMMASIPNVCPNNGESYDLDEKSCF